MPKITVKDGPTFEAEAETRLINALEANDVDILHRCGGNARCTTCRVAFVEGEPDKMTEAELNKLQDQGSLGEFRLSCQILCDHDMTVEPLLSKASEKLDDAGPTPEPHITPDPVWVDRP